MQFTSPCVLYRGTTHIGVKFSGLRGNAIDLGRGVKLGLIEPLFVNIWLQAAFVKFCYSCLIRHLCMSRHIRVDGAWFQPNISAGITSRLIKAVLDAHGFPRHNARLGVEFGLGHDVQVGAILKSLIDNALVLVEHYLRLPRLFFLVF